MKSILLIELNVSKRAKSLILSDFFAKYNVDISALQKITTLERSMMLLLTLFQEINKSTILQIL